MKRVIIFCLVLSATQAYATDFGELIQEGSASQNTIHSQLDRNISSVKDTQGNQRFGRYKQTKKYLRIEDKNAQTTSISSVDRNNANH